MVPRAISHDAALPQETRLAERLIALQYTVVCFWKGSSMAALWSRLLLPMMAHFRKKRVAFLKTTFPHLDQYKVLDLGGSLHFWEVAMKTIKPAEVTILNVSDDEQSGVGRKVGDLAVQLYDGKVIPYTDDYFDLVICNSVIEHVPLGSRCELAREIMRVGRHVFVQTPAYEFFLEPHFLAPFIHWIPRNIARKMVYFTPYGVMSLKNEGQAQKYFDEVELLKRSDMELLFENTCYASENFLGMTKSHMILR